MSTKNDCSLKDTEAFRNLVLDNPELPVIFFCGEDSWNGENSYTQAMATKVEIESLILYDNLWLTDEDYGEELADELSDEEEYKDFTNEEFGAMIDKKVAEAEFVKAIVIWIG